MNSSKQSCFITYSSAKRGSRQTLTLILSVILPTPKSLAAMMAGGVDAPIVSDSPSTETRERRRGWRLKAIGNYDIQFLAASTGSSHVYKAKAEDSDSPVALKVHRRDQHVEPREVERFRREARILGDLAFEGVVPLLEVGEEEGSLYVAMPWIEGITLLEAIQILRGERQPGDVDPRPLPPVAKARLISHVAQNLIEIHARGILHRDLKPSNIMLDVRGQGVLIDFGIARREGESALTRTGDQVQGTPRYLAPEILKGDILSTNEQGEVYALGLTLHELLLERPAYEVENRKQLFDAVLGGPPLSADQVDVSIPHAISKVVDKAIAHDPGARYVDMKAFAAALSSAIEKPADVPDLSKWALPLLFGAIIVLVVWVLSR